MLGAETQFAQTHLLFLLKFGVHFVYEVDNWSKIYQGLFQPLAGMFQCTILIWDYIVI
jgi:hypothetical protein